MKGNSFREVADFVTSLFAFICIGSNSGIMERMIEERVCVVGCGLMGGSLALALRPFLSHLTIVDKNPNTLAATAWLADMVTDNVVAGIQAADVVVLATPVRAILQLLAELPGWRPEGCLVLDLGSTKQQICAAMAALPPAFAAIGGHPMCGKETAGFDMAASDLYQEQLFILCPHARTTPAIEKLARQIITYIGATPLLLSPHAHDKLVAGVSHLPYVVSAMLMQTAAAMAEDQAWDVSASGFRDTARLAGF